MLLTRFANPPLDVAEDGGDGKVEGAVGDLDVGQRVLGEADVVGGEGQLLLPRHHQIRHGVLPCGGVGGRGGGGQMGVRMASAGKQHH